MSKLILPSLLAFERKLENSDALMFSGIWENRQKDSLKKDDKEVKLWQPIAITSHYNRGTQSSFSATNKEKIVPNIFNTDDANLPLEHDTLKVSFSLRIIGDVGVPFACNNTEFGKKISEKVKAFYANPLFDELARRYALNIANGRFLWRNRVGAENVVVYVQINGQETPIEFNAYDYDLRHFNDVDDKIKQLSEAIKKGLQESSFVFIEVNAYVKLGKGQRVFPSQEMNMGEKRKSLFKIKNQAAMHNVKIGNALRTIDDWYKDAQFPIAVEPFGAVTQQEEAYRKNESEGDLYSLMEAWVNDDTLTNEEQAFVTANLIRGGVFSGESKKKKDTAEES